MSPERHEREDSSDADVFHVQIQGVRFLRPEVMRGRTGSVSRGRPRLDLRNGNARGSKENMIPVPGEGLSVSGVSLLIHSRKASLNHCAIVV
jgi:hypothetical protein